VLHETSRRNDTGGERLGVGRKLQEEAVVAAAFPESVLRKQTGCRPLSNPEKLSGEWTERCGIKPVGWTAVPEIPVPGHVCKEIGFD
jgi:hypothetical protein